MSEEKNKNKDKPASAKASAGKDDCPLCSISPETIKILKNLKESKKNDKQNNKEAEVLK